MEIVPDRLARTLLPIIQQHVQSRTIVHSDEWAAYNCVQQLASVAQHGVVNHTLHFVDPATGVHTQNVESYWNRVKTKFKRMKGVHESMISSYLDEFMWRERHGRTASTAMASLCRDNALRYPVHSIIPPKGTFCWSTSPHHPINRFFLKTTTFTKDGNGC